MALYSALQPLIEANQWFRNGDHPEDRTINRINTGRIVRRNIVDNPDSLCDVCGKLNREHGVIEKTILAPSTTPEENLVCPGDYIITHRTEKGRVTGYSVYKKQLFEYFYGPYREPIE